MTGTMIVRLTVAAFVSASVAISSLACDVNIYILTGQSNSLGTTEREGANFDPGTHFADSKIAFYWSNVASSSSDLSNLVLYGDSGQRTTSLKMQQGDKRNPKFWGPEFGMARRLFEVGHTNTMIIKVSRGGGGNSHWLPTTGHMANHLFEQLDIALTALQDAGKRFEVKGFMYLQGESNSEIEAAFADTRLQTLIERVKAYINTKYADAADNMYSVAAEIASSTSSAARVKTYSLQKAIAMRSNTIGFFETNDLPLKTDRLHFGKSSKMEIGRRFADAFISQSWVENPNLLAGYSANQGSQNTVPHPVSQGLSQKGKATGILIKESSDAIAPAWQIRDTSRRTMIEYSQDLINADFQKMFSRGWRFRVSAKVLSGTGAAYWSLSKTNDPGWMIGGPIAVIGFRLSRVNGDELEVHSWNGSSAINLGPDSANQFHTFEVSGKPGSAHIGLCIDDELQCEATDLHFVTAADVTDNALVFNSGSTPSSVGEVLWNEVSLQVLSDTIK